MRKIFTAIVFLLCYLTAPTQTEVKIVDTFYQKRTAFIATHWKDLNNVDTSINSKKRLTINFKNSQGYCKQRIEIRNDTGCIIESFTNYIDTDSLILYSEHWSFACQNTDPNDYDGLLDTYRRFVYDSTKRKISEFVLNQSTGTWHYDYSYTGTKEQASKAQKITRNQFWTD